MGWLGPVVGNTQHEGYVLPLFADGQEGSGVSSGRGYHVGEYDGTDDGDWRSAEQVTGWHAACECGWRGVDWTRVYSPAAAGAPAWSGPEDGCVADRANRLIYMGHTAPWADLDDDAENAVIDELRAHIRPWKALEEVGDLAEQHARIGREIDAAVASARSGGATWADVGRAVGITRQSARERWEKKEW
jgi:hypothetical protein